MAKVEISPCDDIETIKNNPTILGNCYPNYKTIVVGEGLSPRELLAIEKAKMNAQRNLAFLMANDTSKYEMLYPGEATMIEICNLDYLNPFIHNSEWLSLLVS